MTNLDQLTMILSEPASIQEVDAQGCSIIATCIETNEHYRIYESDKEREYYILMSDVVVFQMDEDAMKEGEFSFSINLRGKSGNNCYIPCTFYSIERYLELLSEKESHDSKQKSEKVLKLS